MVKTSVLNDALNAINNAEKSGKRQVLIRPSSKTIIKFLSVMQKHGMFESLFLSLSLSLTTPLPQTPPPPPGLITRWTVSKIPRPLPFKYPENQGFLLCEDLTRSRITHDVQLLNFRDISTDKLLSQATLASSRRSTTTATARLSSSLTVA